MVSTNERAYRPYRKLGSDMSEVVIRRKMERYYEDEPISFTRSQEKAFVPAEYRKMRNLAFGPPFSTGNEAKIFYLQAKFMENFEDDCPYKREIVRYYTTYQSLTTPELRGYFTWRTKLRHGELEKTSLSYAYLYTYELLHLIGSKTAEEGFEKLTAFYEAYGELDEQIRRHLRTWIVDFAIYYDLPPELVRDYVDTDGDEALYTLERCEEAGDEDLFAAILERSSYRLDRSKSYKQYPKEITALICGAYRELDRRYRKRTDGPYTWKCYGRPLACGYYGLFRYAVFYDRLKIRHREYRLNKLKLFTCDDNRWRLTPFYQSDGRSRDLGILVRAADRLMREAYDLRPALKEGAEGKTLVRILQKLLEEQKKAAVPEVKFDLRKLSGIRKSADAVGQRLMTDEERYGEESHGGFAAGKEIRSADGLAAAGACAAEEASSDRAEAGRSGNAAAVGVLSELCVAEVRAEGAETAEARGPESDCPLTGYELRFLHCLLYGGDLQGFLSEHRLMASVLAESINEQLFDEFADNVLDFDDSTPIVVEDYLEDLKGMIPK